MPTALHLAARIFRDTGWRVDFETPEKVRVTCGPVRRMIWGRAPREGQLPASKDVYLAPAMRGSTTPPWLLRDEAGRLRAVVVSTFANGTGFSTVRQHTNPRTQVRQWQQVDLDTVMAGLARGMHPKELGAVEHELLDCRRPSESWCGTTDNQPDDPKVILARWARLLRAAGREVGA